MSQIHRNIHFLSLNQLREKGVDLSLFAYPSGEENRVLEVLRELDILGVAAVGVSESSGKLAPYLLGKGGRGMVFLGLVDDVCVAVKVVRTDAAVPTVVQEAMHLGKANTVDVGPRLLNHSQHVIIMEYVEGETLAQFIKANNRAEIAEIVGKILDQAHLLDKIHLDHGQLSNSSDHVIISPRGKATIIDFSHSSQQRKPRNVTSFTSYLIRTILRERKNDPTLLTHLKQYKEKQEETSFNKLKDTIIQLILA
ncbi:MAG: RIO1 family regulatory kinase/ATPase [Candidatus Caldarchaeum sp.]|jgi:putative serine/threonine protein kinase